MLELNKVYCMDCLEGIKQMIEQNIVPDLIICDPPYEFESSGNGLYNQKDLMKRIRAIKTNSFDFYAYVPLILDLQKDRVNAYFFCNKALLPKYLNLALDRGLSYDILALRKHNPIPAKNSSYVPELEYVVFLRSSAVCFNNDLPLSYYKKVFSIVVGHSALSHPNEKPLRLISNYIRVSSKEGDLVADFFLGSGTTAMACRQLNRRFIGFEIDGEVFKIAEKRLAFKTLSESLCLQEVKIEGSS